MHEGVMKWEVQNGEGQVENAKVWKPKNRNGIAKTEEQN